MKKLSLVLLALVLSACGGGGSSTPTTPTTKTVLIVRTPAQLRWADADAYCKALSVSGQTGWRLPTQPELSAYAQGGTDIGSGAVWSSSEAGATMHYYVSLNSTTGSAFAASDASYFYVRCAHD